MATQLPKSRPLVEARARLAEAVESLDLSEAEQRILQWLCRWEPETINAIASVIRKARRAFPLDES